MEKLDIVGQSKQRVDALVKVTGQAKYSADLRRPDMLIAKALFAKYPHAIIKSIDVSKAEKLDGVAAVMTAKDLPGRNGYGILVPDKPVIAERKTKYEGDPVAIVAAVNLDTAEKAIALIEVVYEPLHAYDDPREAMKDDAVKIHEQHPAAEKGNILCVLKLDRGDVDKAFAEADIVIENDYETPMVDHAYLEPDIAIAELDSTTGGLILTSAGQAVYATKRCLAPVFGLPQSKVRVVAPVIGGGFGGKEDSTLDVCAVAGVLALKTRRPVYFELTRAEVFRTTGKRHASYIKHRLAANRDGKIVAIDVQTILDKGAYVSMGGTKAPLHGVTMRTLVYAGGTYAIPNARARAYSVFTNHPYSCAFRGFGAPQVQFAVECQIDELAHRIGMDPVAVRTLNMLKDGDMTITGQIMKESRGLGLGECIQKVTQRIKWDQPIDHGKGPVRRGKGFGAFIYGTGIPLAFEGSSAFANLELDGTLNVAVSSTEMGQGIATTVAQLAAQTFGVKYESVDVVFSDTGRSPDSGPTVGSRSAVMVGNAVAEACRQLRSRLLEVAGKQFFQADPSTLTIKDGLVYVEGRPENAEKVATIAARAFVSQVPLSVIGTWFPPQPTFNSADGQGEPYHAYGFGAHAVEIEVDTETGVINVLRSVLACDVGKAINPAIVEGQMEGGAAQAVGYGLMEEPIMAAGVMQNTGFHNYMIPTTKDLPDLESVIVEHSNELGPYGAKGIGEPPLIAGAPAIRNAIYDAIGVKINIIPLTPRRVLEAIRQQAGQAR
ncbi:xanthine dehydrogenase family protein molybdopterin-binding subunit [Xanthobacteraceae bacterium Astr-EGSB]|uniref:xanthine dehydrogenase family protein molybdopterin-binding subunit n=1 Tax=Astrobacterium formosum TaxID=3069710 RepID=UPI0027B68632|nr:xanthine dehydrogenase family protein molybdopterin-binding subunit [Xanthobacteraceae bacterium Astr-EGSB]